MVNEPKPAPSSLSMRLDMAVEGVLEPRMRLFLARTKLVANLVLTKETAQLRRLSHFSDNFFANLQRKVSASFLIRPSYKTTKRVKLRLCFRQDSRCFFFFSISALLSNLEGARRLIYISCSRINNTIRASILEASD